MNKFEDKNLTAFKWFVLENFPFIEADFDALTEWQLFCKLGTEINKIIDSQNVVGEQAETLTNAFNNLKNYVDNYFDNLDEEIGRVNTVINLLETDISKIKEEQTRQNENISTNADEITNLKNENSYLQNVVKQAFTETSASGTELTINNTIEARMEMKLNGNTSQNGEPTPSSPVDVNVVSGSNVVNTSNKNVFNLHSKSALSSGISYEIYNSQISLNGTTNRSPVYIYKDTTNYLTLKAGTYRISSSIISGSYTLSGDVTIDLRNVSDNTSLLTIAKSQNYTSNVSVTLAQDTNVYLQIFTNATNNVFNNFVIGFQIEKGSSGTPYIAHQGKELPLDLGNIELCKIGNYQDYFYKSGSKWYLHKEIGKDVVDKNSTISIINTGTSNWYYKITPKKIAPTASQTNQICNYYPNREIFNGNTNKGILKISNGEQIRIRYGTEDTVANFKTWLASNNIILYSILATATNTEITDTTLISQLEALKTAMSYTEQTNISQINNGIPFNLDVIALTK